MESSETPNRAEGSQPEKKPDDLLKKKFLEDDPLGLFGAKPPEPSPPPPPKTTPSPEAVKTPGASQEAPKAPLPEKEGEAPPAVPSPSASPGKPAPGGVDLDALLREPPPKRPPFPKAGSSGVFPPPSTGARPSARMKIPITRKEKFLAFWEKQAARCRLSVKNFTLAVGGVVLALTAFGVWFFSERTSVTPVESVLPFHLVKVQSRDMVAMDVSRYFDLDRRLEAMGFNRLLEFTVPQLPSPNYFDVHAAAQAPVYAEILVFPGSSTPKMAFVTPVEGGLWFATDGWEGKDVETEWRISRHYPGLSVDRLYVKHMENLQAYLKKTGLKAQPVRESRYVGALSDHLREFFARTKALPRSSGPEHWH